MLSGDLKYLGLHEDTNGQWQKQVENQEATELSKGAVNTEHASGFGYVQIKYVAVPLKKAKTQRKIKETMMEVVIVLEKLCALSIGVKAVLIGKI